MSASPNAALATKQCAAPLAGESGMLSILAAQALDDLPGLAC